VLAVVNPERPVLNRSKSNSSNQNAIRIDHVAYYRRCM